MDDKSRQFDIVKLSALAVTAISAILYLFGYIYLERLYLSSGIPSVLIPDFTIEESIYNGALITILAILPALIAIFFVLKLINKVFKDRLWHSLQSLSLPTRVIAVLVLFSLLLIVIDWVSGQYDLESDFYTQTPIVETIIYKNKPEAPGDYKGFHLIGKKDKYFVLLKKTSNKPEVHIINADVIHEIALIHNNIH